MGRKKDHNGAPALKLAPPSMLTIEYIFVSMPEQTGVFCFVGTTADRHVLRLVILAG